MNKTEDTSLSLDAYYYVQAMIHYFRSLMPRDDRSLRPNCPVHFPKGGQPSVSLDLYAQLTHHFKRSLMSGNSRLQHYKAEIVKSRRDQTLILILQLSLLPHAFGFHMREIGD